MRHLAPARAIPIIAAVALTLLTGCQSGYRNFAGTLDASLAAGDYAQAARFAAAAADEQTDSETNRVIYNLEAARAAQAAGDFRASREYFSRVHADVRPYLDTQAEAKFTEAGATTLVNQTTAIYRATPVERIMATALNAVNSIAMGDMQEARVQLNLTRDWQQDAVRRFGDTIDENTRRLENNAARQGVPLKENSVMAAVAPYYQGLDDMRGYADFGNPFASHLRGVFLLSRATGPADLEQARFDLRRAVAMSPQAARMVTPDLEAVATGSADAEPTIWIYFLTGRAASLEELRLDIPIPFGNVNYVSAAIPRLVTHDDFVPDFTVQTAAGTVDAVELADVDSMVGAEFGQRLPRIVMQEALSSALKAAATYAARDQGGGLAQLAGILYQALSTSADVRSWRGMPKRVMLARVPTPDNGRVQARAGAIDASFTVEPGKSHIVVITLPSSASRAASIVTAGLDTGNFQEAADAG